MTSNQKKVISFILVWAVSATVGVYLRMQPLATHRSHDASEKAMTYVYKNIAKSVTKSIDKNFPKLSPDEKNRLIKRNIDAIIRNEGPMVRKTINHVSKVIDKNSDQGFKYPYLLASDSFYYYDLTQNIADTGKLGNTIKGSKYLNEQMLAPEGHWEPFNLHPYVGYGIYRAFKLFNNNVPLIFAISFTPVIIVSLALIPYLLILSISGCSRLVSMISAIVLVSAPSFIRRSAFGWYDNDPYNPLFLFAILLCVFVSLKKTRHLKENIFWGTSAAILMTLYSLFWHGWVFLLSIILLSAFLIILYHLLFIRNHTQTKSLTAYFGTILIGTLLGISIVFGPKEFFILFQEGWIALKEFLSPQLAPWPDLYLGVGELRKPPFNILLHFVGGIPFFCCAMLGLITSIVDIFKSRNLEKTYQTIILSTLLASTLILTLGAQRFILFLLVPLSLLFPLGLQFLFRQMDTFIFKRLPKNIYQNKFSHCTIWVFIFVLLIPFLSNKEKIIPMLLNKIYNPTWEKALLKIKNETPANAIVNAWWPPGHFIKAVANRRVTFDGATINKPQGYWLSNVFLNRDEKEALGILRMLNNSANKAADYLTENEIKLSEAVSILKDIGKISRQDAKHKLTSNLNLSKSQIEHLLDLTHNKPPPSYLLIFHETVEKNTQFKFVGNWNFKKIEEINASPGQLKHLPPNRSKRYIQFLWNLVGGPDRYSGILTQVSQKGSALTFEEDVKVNLSTKQTTIKSKKYGQGIPLSIFYLEDNKVVEKKFPNANLSYSVILYRIANQYNCVLLDRRLAKSLLMQLYFFNATGLEYFKPFVDETDLTKRTRILVFEINWNKFLIDLAGKN